MRKRRREGGDEGGGGGEEGDEGEGGEGKGGSKGMKGGREGGRGCGSREGGWEGGSHDSVMYSLTAHHFCGQLIPHDLHSILILHQQPLIHLHLLLGPLLPPPQLPLQLLQLHQGHTQALTAHRKLLSKPNHFCQRGSCLLLSFGHHKL